MNESYFDLSNVLLCWSISCGDTGQQWTAAGQGLWVQQTWAWSKPSWRRSPWTPPQRCQNSRDWEIDPWRAQTESCARQDPGETSSDPKRDGPRLACECPGVSSGGVGQCWPAAGLGARVWQCFHGTFWRRSPLSSLPPPCLARGKLQGGNTAPAISRKLD